MVSAQSATVCDLDMSETQVRGVSMHLLDCYHCRWGSPGSRLVLLGLLKILYCKPECLL